jgi:hypothetical protein
MTSLDFHPIPLLDLSSIPSYENLFKNEEHNFHHTLSFLGKE